MRASLSLRKFIALRQSDGCPWRGAWKSFTGCERPSNRRDHGWQSSLYRTVGATSQWSLSYLCDAPRFTGIFLAPGRLSSTIRLGHVTAGVQNGIHPGCGGDGTRVLRRRVVHHRARERRDMSAGVASELKALGHKPGAFPFRSTSLFLVSVSRLKEKPRR
jgi:hypothetical protein